MTAVQLKNIGGGIATITLDDGKVNIMTKQVWDDLIKTLKTAEVDPSIRAVIYRSGLSKNVFTAGNDVRISHLNPLCRGVNNKWMKAD